MQGEMTRYLISFDDGAMTFAQEDLPAVAEASHAVVREAKDAGVWVFGGGLQSASTSTVVDGQGETPVMTDGPYLETKEYLASFYMLDCESLERAHEIAADMPFADTDPVELWPVLHDAATDL